LGVPQLTEDLKTAAFTLKTLKNQHLTLKYSFLNKINIPTFAVPINKLGKGEKLFNGKKTRSRKRIKSERS
jgi:hypothetical protein